ncbi:MAG: hypothetical protein M1832_003099 [Thelocarpon impressellum]|nr:MAG: hypothetical protein M1832_003099 [Thelocarpon impressellum]
MASASASERLRIDEMLARQLDAEERARAGSPREEMDYEYDNGEGAEEEEEDEEAADDDDAVRTITPAIRLHEPRMPDPSATFLLNTPGGPPRRVNAATAAAVAVIRAADTAIEVAEARATARQGPGQVPSGLVSVRPRRRVRRAHARPRRDSDSSSASESDGVEPVRERLRASARRQQRALFSPAAGPADESGSSVDGEDDDTEEDDDGGGGRVEEPPARTFEGVRLDARLLARTMESLNEIMGELRAQNDPGRSVTPSSAGTPAPIMSDDAASSSAGSSSFVPSTAAAPSHLQRRMAIAPPALGAAPSPLSGSTRPPCHAAVNPVDDQEVQGRRPRSRQLLDCMIRVLVPASRGQPQPSGPEILAMVQVLDTNEKVRFWYWLRDHGYETTVLVLTANASRPSSTGGARFGRGARARGGRGGRRDRDGGSSTGTGNASGTGNGNPVSGLEMRIWAGGRMWRHVEPCR